MPPSKPVVGYAIRRARITDFLGSFALLLPDPATNLRATRRILKAPKRKVREMTGLYALRAFCYRRALSCLCDALSSITLRLALLLCVSYRCSNRVGIFCAHLIFVPRVCWGHEIGFSESVDPRAAVFAWSVVIALPPVQVSLL